MDTWSAAIMLFLIMDPLGNLPVVLSILRRMEPKRQRRVLIRELLLALAIMLVFLFAGRTILNVLELKQESVTITGGIILFLIALRMIFPRPGGETGMEFDGEPVLVPMATPMIAGPSLLAALILLANQQPGKMLDWTLALGAAWLATAVILMASPWVSRFLGERGMAACERLMGMILVMISVQMFLDGVKSFLELDG